MAQLSPRSHGDGEMPGQVCLYLEEKESGCRVPVLGGRAGRLGGEQQPDIRVLRGNDF